MPSKIDPGTLEIGNGKAAQDSVSVSSLDFASVVDFQAALSAHINDPDGAHPASAISLQDQYDQFDDTEVEGALVEVSDLIPEALNYLGEEKSGVPNSGVPDWGKLEDSETGSDGWAQTGGFTCDTANHAHASWGGSDQGSSPADWLAETHVLIPSSITDFSITGTLFPADRGYLVLLYAKNGVFDNTSDTVEVGKLNLAANFDEVRRRNPSVGYQQLDYTAGVGTDIFSLTYRLPALKEYTAGVPYTVYDFNYLQYQLAHFTTGTIDLTASPFDIGTDVDFGSLKLFHFVAYTNVAAANYNASNIYGDSGKLDIYSDTDPDLPSLGPAGTDFIVEPAWPAGSESVPGASPWNASLPDTHLNKLASGSAIFAGTSADRGKILVLSGSTQGNNGTYQVLQEIDASNVYVSPDFPGTLPDSSGITYTMTGPNVFRLSGIYHYGEDGFWANSDLSSAFWNNTYLTGKVSDSKVSSDYLSDEDPLEYDLSDFGVSTRVIPYHELDLNDSINAPDGFDLDKGNGPDPTDLAEYIGPFISGSDSGGSSGDAKVRNTIRTPFDIAHIDAITQTGEKILCDSYEQVVTGRSQLEDFNTELFRYDLKSDLLALGQKYPLVPYTRAISSGSDGVISSTNTFTSVSAAFTSGDTGRILLISGTSNGNDDTYVLTYVSATEVSVFPNWPGAGESTVSWRFPIKFDSDVSLASFTQDELQVLGGHLVYPQRDHTSDSYPSANQIDYSAIYSGDSANTIRWYTRLFDTESPQNVGKLKISGIRGTDFEAGTYTGDLATDHTGGAVVLVKVPGVSGWLDLGRNNGDPNLDKTQDYYGCKIYAPDVTNLVTGLGNPYGIALDIVAGKIYWADESDGKIQRSNLDGSSIEELVTGLSGPYGIALDTVASKMYWTDDSDNKIQRANLDGSSVEDLVTGLSGPYGIALDTDKMYWVDGGSKIQRSNLDGSSVEDLITGLSGPYGIALDTVAGKMYWTDDSDDKIQRANLNGSNIEDLVTGLNGPHGIALDIAAGKMYWVDGGSDVQRANLDGSSVEDLVTGLSGPQDITLDTVTGKMYWTDDSDSEIQQTNLDGTGVVYSYTTEFYTQDNGAGEFPIAVRVGFIKDGTGEDLEITEIEWTPYE